MHVAHIDGHLQRMRKMSRNVLTSARMLDGQARMGGHRVKCWMVTTTYAPQHDWKPKDIAKALDCFKQWCKRRGYPVRYTWKLELQKRGAPHYHVMLWLPHNVDCPKFDLKGWWQWGITNRIQVFAGTKYMAKYCAKGVGDGKLPKGARIYGISGLLHDSRCELRWWNSPSYIKESLDRFNSDVRRVTGGFINKVTGEYIEAKFEFVRMWQGCAVMVPKHCSQYIKFIWSPVSAATGF